MRLSRYFLPLLKETPSEATIASHRYMLRAGMVKQDSAGIYIWLPLGFKVLKKIENIVREEQNKSGAVEILMPTIQSAAIGKKLVGMMLTDRKCSELKIGVIGSYFTVLLMRI